MMKNIIAPILAMCLTCSCSMVRTTNLNGEKQTLVSFMENTADEERILGPDGSYQERKIGKDQTTGGKLVARSVMWTILGSGLISLGKDAVAASSAEALAETTAGTSALEIESATEIATQELANEVSLAELEAF